MVSSDTPGISKSLGSRIAWFRLLRKMDTVRMGSLLNVQHNICQTYVPANFGLDLAPSLADLFAFGGAPIDCSPILLLMPFGFRIAPCPPGYSEQLA